MKKRFALLLPLIAMVGCAQTPVDAFTPYVVKENGFSTVYATKTADTTVYLMMGPTADLKVQGQEVEKAKGKVADKFYENTVVWKAAAGTALPGADDINVGVDGATFRGWAYYDEDNENVWPDYYTTVPTKNNLALKAIIDGTKASGEGGGGGGGGGGSTPVVAKYGIKFADGREVFGTEMSETDTAGRKQYNINGQAFKVGDIFSLYDSSTNATWAIDLDPYSLGDTAGTGNGWKNYLSKGETTYTVTLAFTGNLYIKLSATAGDQLYIGLA